MMIIIMMITMIMMLVGPPIVSLLNRICLNSAGHWLPLQIHLRACNHHDHHLDNHHYDNDDNNDDDEDYDSKPGYCSGTAFWTDH